MRHRAKDILASMIRRLPVAPPSMALAQVLNMALRLKLLPDDLGWLEGRSFRIEANDVGVQCRLHFANGQFAQSAISEVTIRASAADFLLMMRRKVDPDTLFFQRRLMLEGDTDLGLSIKNLLDSLDLTPVLNRWPLPARIRQQLLG